MCSDSVEQATAAIAAALDTLGHIDWSTIPVPERLDRIEALESTARRLRATSYTAAGTLALEDKDTLGDKPHNVIANRLRISPAEASRRLRTAGLLADRTTITGQPVPPILAGTAAPWHAGLLDEEHVKVITTLLADLAADTPFDRREWAERFLAEKATEVRPDQLKTVAARIAAVLNPDGSFSDVDRARKRGITIGRQQHDGMSSISGLLNPELRATLEAMLGKLAAPGKCNPADQSPSIDGDPDPEAAPRDIRTTAQRNHDGLLAAARSVLASGELGSHHGLPVTVIVTTTVDQLDTAVGVAVTGSGSLLHMTDVIRMAAHSYHYLAVFDEHTGLPLYLGRTRRTASAGQRIVLHATDRGCTYPGCTVPGYLCEADHIDEWINGGHTDIDTLTFACGPHHKLHTNHRWRLRKRADGRTEWIPPPQLELAGGGVNDYHHPETLLPPEDER